jgi:benzil reductase ((S)-benzoin forming)
MLLHEIKMTHCFISGTSRGIGKAIAMRLLKEDDFFVTGISRSCSIDHPRYKHISADLSDTANIDLIGFETDENVKRIILINNSGELGEIKHIGSLRDNDFIRTININLIMPCLLMNKFISKYKEFKGDKIILNMSSGAGKKPIDGWGAYCTTKAGLDMFSMVAAEEAAIDRNGFKIYAVAPGVVNTGMQDEIRQADNADFSRKDEFVGYHENKVLADPDFVANKFFAILAGLFVSEKSIFSINEISQ